MGVSKSAFSQYVRNFDLCGLFNDMGWNNDRTNLPITINEKTYLISGIAEKSGFKIFTCVPVAGVAPPDRETRKKIERNVTKLFQEHLIIFYDDSKSSQIWQLALRKAGLPTKISETHYYLPKDPELLYQRTSGLFFTLDEEEKITIVDVTKRVSDNFQQNNETVTKKFYESFKKEHTAFLKFIAGIEDTAKLDWYASLMLNRLMFCYFIQKQRFLDDNPDYLQQKLKECIAKKGKNKFYSFYRDFLLALFHEGLGAPEHSKKIEIELGRIPYLNGGLFDEHEIERDYRQIQIDDKAFERLFDFFDQWNWHLDTREAATGRDINPDVIGYIFEKYINDRAQMGAYYTKEDITDYISKNCIIPWLFDEVKRSAPEYFTPDSSLWQGVKSSGTEYIYDAVKHGIAETDNIFADLPPEIRQGFNPELENKIVDDNGPLLWEMRKDWNKSAPLDIALPTEIYREVIERRKRFADIKAKIANGEVKEINDFITLNLNIRQFAQNAIEDTENPVFVRNFYKALSGITILDPTCGSGAFLFAALNILEPLYETAIDRMEQFVTEGGKGKYKFFEDTLKLVNAPEHPNLKYFIYKSIILNNLYGVDIMNEAVEIAKLRLFLKLVATVEADYRKPNLGLEPLPDVDFNIRAGNTLVGYATKKQIDEIAGMFVTPEHKKKIIDQCDVVALAFKRYKEIQLTGGDDYREFKKAKDELNGRLNKLTDDLDMVLYVDQYKGDERIMHPNQIKPKDAATITAEYENWFTMHRPFHWFAEYYEIVNGWGGFDVVIGNPPYVELKVVKSFSLIGYSVEDAGNLYAVVLERAESLAYTKSRMGFIVPVSSVSTDRYIPLQSILCKRWLCYSSFDDRPSRLFEGLEHIRLTIHILGWKCEQSELTSSCYNKWNAIERPFLFDSLCFTESASTVMPGSLPKIMDVLEHGIIQKLKEQHSSILNSLSKIGKFVIYYSRKVGYFLQILDFVPEVHNGKGELRPPSEFKDLHFTSQDLASAANACLNSNLFYWFVTVFADCRHVNKREVDLFPIKLDSLIKNRVAPELNKTVSGLMTDLKKNSSNKTMTFQHDTLTVQCIFVKLSKPLIDQIDSLLAVHYGFTHSELDFIINYDIKYRMGKELGGDGGDEE